MLKIIYKHSDESEDEEEEEDDDDDDDDDDNASMSASDNSDQDAAEIGFRDVTSPGAATNDQHEGLPDTTAVEVTFV